MKSLRGVTLLVTFVAVLTAGLVWAKVVSDHDPAADFSSYSTYEWLERENSVETLLPNHLRMRLRRVTEEVLAEKGFLPSPAPPQTDLLLTYYLSTEQLLEINHVGYSSYTPWGYGYWPGFNYGYTEVRSYPEGTLVLDIVDARSRKLVWIGTLQREIRSTNPPGKRIEKGVKKLLKTFPPK
jgi:hypothetical protein